MEVKDKAALSQRLQQATAKARADINYFSNFVLRDNSGQAITQAAIHSSWHAHIDWCAANNLHAAICAPYGHGKTEQVPILRSLHELGKNPNIQLKIVCNTDKNANSRLASIKKYIEESEELHLVYPNLIPGSKGPWAAEKIQVERTSFSKDASVEAWGIFSGGVGSRSDIIFFDDVCDMADITEPLTREKKITTFENVWMNRLRVGTGMAIYIATAWHDQDLTHQLRFNSGWSCLWQGVTEDLSAIRCQLFNADSTHPLWSQYGR